MRRTASGTLCTALVASLLTGCGLFDKEPDPAPALALYAAALTSGDFSKVAFAGSTTEEVAADYKRIIEGTGLTPSVLAGKITEADGDDPTATGTLTWSWPVGTGWSYSSQTELALVKDTWTFTWAPSNVEPDLDTTATLRTRRVAATRADITTIDGSPIVTQRPVVRIGIDKLQLATADQAGPSAQALATLVGIDPTAYAERVAKAGAKAFVEAIVLRKDEVPDAVSSGLAAIPGAAGYDATRALAPTRDFAAPILGSVGDVTAEMVKKSPETYQAGDVAGLSGLQARYDAELGGTPGITVEAVPAEGDAVELFSSAPTDGTAIALTLDVDLQEKAEAALADVGPASALVAIRPSDGAILAAANGPGTGGVNIATFGQAAPGSTFKAVSSLALLRQGLTPDTTVSCTPSVTVDGKKFENYDDYPSNKLGDIALKTAVANSCNTAFISRVGDLTDDALSTAAPSLGLGTDYDVGFPAYFGQVPAPASQVEKAADMIGQGKVLASPMTMATVIASIQAGHTVVPWLVQGHQATSTAPALETSEADALRSMLRETVTTGSASFLSDVPGGDIIAKTGTAEFDKDGNTKLHAWMIAAQDDLAVAVYVDEGTSGSGTAGPILEQFLRAAQG